MEIPTFEFQPIYSSSSSILPPTFFFLPLSLNLILLRACGTIEGMTVTTCLYSCFHQSSFISRPQVSTSTTPLIDSFYQLAPSGPTISDELPSNSRPQRWLPTFFSNLFHQTFPPTPPLQLPSISLFLSVTWPYSLDHNCSCNEASKGLVASNQYLKALELHHSQHRHFQNPQVRKSRQVSLT